MYKNAEKLLNEKMNVSKGTIRSAVTLSRIDQNVRRINSMIHLIQPPSHDEVILPKSNMELTSEDAQHSHAHHGSVHSRGDDPHKQRHEENRMRIRLMKSAALVPPEAMAHRRPLDPQSIDRWISKMNYAIDSTNDAKNRISAAGKKKKKKETVSQAMLINLERKLQQAIKAEYRNRMILLQSKNSEPTSTAQTPAASGGGKRPSPDQDGTDAQQRPGSPSNPNAGGSLADGIAGHQSSDDYQHGVPPSASMDDLASLSSADSLQQDSTQAKKTMTLTTRQLLPYYKLDTVHQFMDIFAKGKRVCSYYMLITGFNCSLSCSR